MCWATHAKLTRRKVLSSGASTGLALLLNSQQVFAVGVPEGRFIDQFLSGPMAQRSDRVRLQLPKDVTYGNTVSFAVEVESPMTAADHVKSVHVFAEGHPFPEMATFRFRPENGPAWVATRIRLEEGEHRVWAVAVLSDGSALFARQDVKATVGGCGTSAGIPQGYVMPTPKPRIKVPEQAQRGAIIEARSMIAHNMETGLRADAAGNLLPRRIIHRMECAFARRRVFAADLSPGIAANAYLKFTFKVEQSGMIEFAWHEEGGAVYRAERRINVD